MFSTVLTFVPAVIKFNERNVHALAPTANENVVDRKLDYRSDRDALRNRPQPRDWKTAVDNKKRPMTHKLGLNPQIQF